MATSSQPNDDEEAGGCSFANAKAGLLKAAEQTKEEYVQCFDELKYECTPEVKPLDYYSDLTKQTVRAWIHIPYLPAFHRPGWLLRYICGPYDGEWLASLIADFCAGLTVALTLIPQALSYAQLANLPAINGLYTAILPSTTYVFFGSSMQLAVGPVAIVSLMVGTLVTQFQPDYATNLEGAVDTAAQAAFNTGIIMTVMGIFNLGSFIHFISHPVMSGFTTGAAMSIGLSQLTSGFGFTGSGVYSAPKAGQPGYEENWEVMEWVQHNWNAKYNYPATGTHTHTHSLSLIHPPQYPSTLTCSFFHSSTSLF